jgi:hypothetical protein
VPYSAASSPLHADDGGDRCYAPDAGRAIALLTTTETLYACWISSSRLGGSSSCV